MEPETSIGVIKGEEVQHDVESKVHDLEMLDKDVTNNNFEITLTPEESEEEARLEKRLKWKLDLVILPLLATTYFLSSMVCYVLN